jgi:hypothetical protein
MIKKPVCIALSEGRFLHLPLSLRAAGLITGGTKRRKKKWKSGKKEERKGRGKKEVR